MPTATTCRTGAIHLAPTQPSPRYLEWVPYDGSRYRTDLATCLTCEPNLFYEWGSLGGTWRIRRTNLNTGPVHVTPWVAVKTAAAWWQQLQNGTAL